MNCNEELNKYGVFQKMFHCNKVNLSDYQEEDIDEENVEMFEGRELQYS